MVNSLMVALVAEGDAQPAHLHRYIVLMSEKKRFLLRLDPELYKVLEKWGADEFRSVNAQIEFLLKMSAKKAEI